MDTFCLECGTKLLGRVDKKFCSDQCRNAFNNKMNRDETAHMKFVNHILRKNRRILRTLNPDGKAKVSKQVLLANGFNFKYFTNVYKTKGGWVYYFCYEYGYLPTEDGHFTLIINKDL